MSATPVLDQCPVLGIGNDFPDVVFLLVHPPSGLHGCFFNRGIHGLACFSSENSALRFSEFVELDGMQVLEKTLDEALDVAKTKPMPIVCLMLVDDLQGTDLPKVYVR